MDPEQVLALARRRVAQAEVFAGEIEETPVSFEANTLKSLQTRHTRGVALRVIHEGRIGFAATTRPDDAEALVDLAVEMAQFGAEARFQMPPRRETRPVEAYDPATLAVSVQQMVEMGRELVAGVLDSAPDVLCDAGVHRQVQRVRIVNSAGADYREETTAFSAGVGGQRVRGTDMLWVGDEASSAGPTLDLAAIVRTVREQLERARINVPVRTAELPVIFTPSGVAGALLSPLLAAFSGRTVLQGASPLADSLGQQVYDPAFDLRDDPTLPGRPTSRAFDDEGVPAHPLALIEEGVVRQFLYDLQTAGLAGRQSTGSAHRSLTSQPQIGPAALVVRPGTQSFAELLRQVDEGLVVEALIGAGQGNVLGGDFSGNVVLGYKVERGQITGRVKNTMVAGNVHQLLREIGAIGSDARWAGDRFHTPSILLPRVSVASAEESA